MRTRSRLLAAGMATLVGCSGDATGPAPQTGRLVNGVRTAGTTSLLVIPALFAGSTASSITPRMLQERLFDGPSSAGTLPGYFHEISGGRFVLRGVVTPWVRTNVSTTASGSGVEGFSQMQDHAIQALRAVDPSVNFGRFDNDGADGVPNSGDDDGIVDGGVLILTSESARVCGTNVGLWPHTSPLLARNTVGNLFQVQDRTPAGYGIIVKAFAVQSASSCVPGTVTGIGVTAHELMHLFFQVPDMYGLGATSETQLAGARFWRTGCWDVMAAGSGWGCGTLPFPDLQMPVHPNPWVKGLVDWVEADTLDWVRDTVVTLRPAALGGRTVRLLIDAQEYFELEYRQRLSYDANLPGSGLLIYHVKHDRAPTPPTCVAFCTQPPLLIEADANDGLLLTMDAGGNKGEASDAFGVLGHTEFSAETDPPAAGANGLLTTLRVSEIQIDEAARVARFRISTLAAPAASRNRPR
jgi:M6 family metalloprotease-like protein